MLPCYTLLPASLAAAKPDLQVSPNPVMIRAGEIGFCCGVCLKQLSMDAKLGLSSQDDELNRVES
ncbi:hypothetical protein EXT46_04460 [Pseudoalteromonas sp. CO325X]|uniref:hypothetical protein n=1 Tax=Pseudoalteromonas sp. CO325X TaxID=1777262 RepID=UPI0010230945|nr:hypothetical protein [Pseudoalteromonas sp. CO325X]RZF84039.1 hypothetical protein EXT46_04460 [Pseudoalteromonas sp. CO325X]